MTRVAIIGNSHVGPYKRAWDLDRNRWPGVSVDFFAAPGANFARLALTDGRHLAPAAGLAPRPDRQLRAVLTRVNGRTEVDLGPADRVVWVGFGHHVGMTTFEAVGDLLGAVEVDGMPHKAPRGTGGTPPRPVSRPVARPVSRPMFEATLAALAARLVPGPDWQGWPPGRLTFSPIHRPADDVLRHQSPLGKCWRRFARTGAAGRRGLDLYADALEAQLAPLGISLFRQPAATIGRYGLTRGELTRDSLYFSGRKHPEHDVYHMNVDYGRIALGALFEHLGLGAGRVVSETGAAVDPALV